jgi:hypothetical protein
LCPEQFLQLPPDLTHYFRLHIRDAFHQIFFNFPRPAFWTLTCSDSRQSLSASAGNPQSELNRTSLATADVVAARRRGQRTEASARVNVKVTGGRTRHKGSQFSGEDPA